MKGRLELDLLRSFLMVCEDGSFSRAAEKLYIYQPALSRKMQTLERILGRTLIERSKRGISLTENVDTELCFDDGDFLRDGLESQQLDMVVLLEPIEAANYTHIKWYIKDRWLAVMPKDTYPTDKKR